MIEPSKPHWSERCNASLTWCYRTPLANWLELHVPAGNSNLSWSGNLSRYGLQSPPGTIIPIFDMAGLKKRKIPEWPTTGSDLSPDLIGATIDLLITGQIIPKQKLAKSSSIEALDRNGDRVVFVLDRSHPQAGEVLHAKGARRGNGSNSHSI